MHEIFSTFTFGGEDVYQDAYPCEQKGARLAVSAANDIQTEIDEKLGGKLDGCIDKMGQVKVQSKASDVQTDAIVCRCNSVPRTDMRCETGLFKLFIKTAFIHSLRAFT